MNTRSFDPPPAGDERFQRLSALADGETAATQDSCDAWRDDASVRERWHAYHLIGDVMRSEELASPPGRDAAFLAALRARLTSEPVVLAPAAPDRAPAAPRAAPARLQRWLTPAAVAAGFMVVAVVLLVARQEAPADRGGVLAGAAAPVDGVKRVAIGGGAASAPSALVVDGQLIRDAQLDAYLRAHRDAGGGASIAVPGGAMRSVETLAPSR
jgi:sigma-E factor negative regulatory protein RseA